MVDRVGHQVAHDALHPAGVGDDDELGAVGRCDHSQLHPAGVGDGAQRLHGAVHDLGEVQWFGGQVGYAGVQPGDLQQICQQQFEPVEFVHQQLGRPGQAGRELSAGRVQHVGSHPHRGQRGTQLVRDVRGEPALQLAELLQLRDLLLEAVGHLVERLGQPRHVVLADHPHPLVQVTFGEFLGDLRGLPHGTHHLAGHQVRDGTEQHQQYRAAEQQGLLHDREGALLSGQREQQINLQWPGSGAHRGPHRQHRDRAVLALHGGDLGGQLAAFDELAQVLRHVLDRARRRLQPTVSRRVPVDQYGLERPGHRLGGGLPGGSRRQPVQGGLQLLGHVVRVRVDRGQLSLQDRLAVLGLRDRGVLLGGHQLRGDLPLQHHAEHEHHGQRQGKGADHDAQLHRTPPQRLEAVPPVADLLADTADQPPHHAALTRPHAQGNRPSGPSTTTTRLATLSKARPPAYTGALGRHLSACGSTSSKQPLPNPPRTQLAPPAVLSCCAREDSSGVLHSTCLRPGSRTEDGCVRHKFRPGEWAWSPFRCAC